MAVKFAVANQKGGVGKTTTALNLAAALAEDGRRVLLIDLDPQGNTTVTFGLQLEGLQVTVADLLIHPDLDVRYAVYRQDNLHLIPANLGLEEVALGLQTVRLREMRLARRLTEIDDQYDFMVIDCPPSIGLLTENALVAADQVIIPVDMGFYSLVGVTQILGAIEEIRDGLNPHLSLCGLVATKVAPGSSFSRAVLEKLRMHFGERVFNTVVRYCERIQEAPSHGVTIFEYAPDSEGAQDFITLASEVQQWTRISNTMSSANSESSSN